MSDKSFAVDIWEFYEAFLTSVADSINNLAKIQEDHKEGYDKLKEIQIDPTKLHEKFKEMDNLDRAKLLDFLFQVSTFEQRLVTLFKLSSEGQKQLANDLRTFIAASKSLMEKKE